MSGRTFKWVFRGGIGSSLLFASLLLPWSGCRGPEYAAHQPVTGVDRPYRPGSGEGKSGILEGRRESGEGAGENLEGTRKK